MPHILIIADDLTGGNATGAHLTQSGIGAACLLPGTVPTRHLEKADALICITDSRGMDQDDAYRIVFHTAKHFLSVDTLLCGKRIDSTLRGNIASETQAMQDVLGDTYMAAVVAAFPAAGRCVHQGKLYLDNRLLTHSRVKSDLRTPPDARVEAVFQGTRRKTAGLTVSDYERGSEHCLLKLQAAYQSGVRIVIFDCCSEADLERIADLLLQSGLPFFSVDPGHFTGILARRIIPSAPPPAPECLAIVGSIYPQTRAQIDYLAANTNSHIVTMRIGRLIGDGQTRRDEIDRVVGEILSCRQSRFAHILVGDGLTGQSNIDIAALAARRNCTQQDILSSITDAFGIASRDIMAADVRFRALFVCGGDIALAVCRHLESPIIHPLLELKPLMVMGELFRGPFQGTKIVTKGGSIGGEDYILRAVQSLRDTAQVYPK